MEYVAVVFGNHSPGDKWVLEQTQEQAEASKGTIPLSAISGFQDGKALSFSHRA